MGRPALAYLHQNRHGSFKFRWRPPPVVADHFVQLAFEFSLATKVREVAWRRALPATIRVNRLVATLRTMSSSKKPKKPHLTTPLVRFHVMPDGKDHMVDYNAGDPAEVAEAERIFDELLKAVSELGAEVSRPYVSHPALPGSSSVGERHVGLTISAAFGAFREEKKRRRRGRVPGMLNAMISAPSSQS